MAERPEDPGPGAEGAPPGEPDEPEARMPDGSAESLMAPALPAAFHINGVKLRVMAVLAGAGAALFLRAAFRAPAGPEAPPLALLWIAGLIFGAAAVFLWRTGGDRRPLLEVREEGLRDRLFGDIPWSDLRGYRLHASLFNPGFGYDLKRGVRPPRNATLFRIQALMNKSSALPQRSFRKQMMVGGAEPMLLACRAARPDLDAS